MGKMKKKLTSGEATTYVSRKQALKKLQISLPNFKRICILKGIYPQEPKHRKKVGKGSTEPMVYYHIKDIQFLAHEPILEKFRQLRIYVLKVKKAREKGDKDRENRLKRNKPRYHLVNLVKERYPTKEDALRDLNDGLNLISLFSRLPKLTQFNPGLIGLSRRLLVEFLNLIIAKQALRQVFISIKGFYIRAELDNIEITWIMPHNLGCHVPSEVDFRTLATCVEFDTTMMGCLLKRLYSDASLVYPPKLKRNVEDDFINEDFCTDKETVFEFLSALSHPLKRLDEDIEEADLEENMAELEAMDDNFSAAVEKQRRITRLQSLFRGKKFFLNREVPREVLCFLIRCCGGDVSWDRLCGPGSTFTEDDPTISYQIIDRPMNQSKSVITRNYVQPQWIADSINAVRLMPVQDYFPGVTLPPHLSPFALGTDSAGYQPPEADYLRGLVTLEEIRAGVEREGVIDSDEAESDEDEEEEDDLPSESEEDIEKEELKVPLKREKPAKSPASMKVVVGAPEDEQTISKKAEVAKNAERKLREMLLPKRHKELYKKIVYSKKRSAREVKEMTAKRKAVDSEITKSKKRKQK